MAKAFPMVKEMISKLIESRSKIPTWVLTSFNDPVVKLRKKTNDVREFRSGINQLRYGGGRDPEGQAFRGAVCLEFKPGTKTYFVFTGIEVTLNNMPDKGVILVVTDAGTKRRELEEEIKKKSVEKNIKIFILFSPKCWAKELCSLSMPSYNRVSEKRIFNQTDFDSEDFLKSVVYTVSHYAQIEHANFWYISIRI